MHQDQPLSIRQKKGRKAGTIILIHGNSSSSAINEHLLADDEFDYSIVAIDLPGHGENQPSKDIEHYFIKHINAQLKKTINNYQDELLLIGHSLGGHLAIHIANEIENLKGLVISGTSPLKAPLNLEEAFFQIPELKHMYTEHLDDEVVRKTIEIATHINSKEILDRLTSDFQKTDPSFRSTLFKEIMSGLMPNEASLFQKLALPKYIITTEYEKVVNQTYVLSLDPEAENYMIKNAGHYPQLEQADEWNSIILKIAKEVFSN